LKLYRNTLPKIQRSLGFQNFFHEKLSSAYRPFPFRLAQLMQLCCGSRKNQFRQLEIRPLWMQGFTDAGNGGVSDHQKSIFGN
jgi:hypothetical protein